jgi:hypothetical protein
MSELAANALLPIFLWFLVCRMSHKLGEMADSSAPQSALLPKEIDSAGGISFLILPLAVG